MYTTRDSDEANAPLYNPPQEVAKPALPEKTASPIEVVNFITKLLIVTRHLTESHAHDIASKWTFGTGDDLLNTYPAQMYREIFGSESGWMVYKEVMLLNYETSHPEGNHRRDGCEAHAPMLLETWLTYITGVGLAITIPIMIAIILLGPRATNSGNMLAIYTVVFGGIFSAIGILIFFAM